MRVAIIDLGTNTFNLLVVERREEGRFSFLHTEERAVFLGKGMVDGMITPQAMERAFSVLGAYTAVARSMMAERVVGFGTSALRRARNARHFISRAKSLMDLEITVIAGEEEAELILLGTRQALTFTAKPMLVMDIGGGSIEFILATDKALMWKRSFEIGATALLELFRPSDPMILEDQFRIAAYIDAQLQPLFAVMERHWPTTLVGSAGSFDTLAELVAISQGWAIDPAMTTSVFDVALFDEIKADLLAADRDARLAMPGLPEFRVDTIPLALIAIERVLLQGIEEIRWSRYALREGAAERACS